MVLRRLQLLAQAVGFLVLGFLAVYGLFTLGSGVIQAAAPASPAATVAATSSTFNYQGYLRREDGSLVTGQVDMEVKIYATLDGVTPIYTEVLTDVNVLDGYFNVVLGDNPADPGTPLSSAFSAGPRYIGVTVTPGDGLSVDGNGELIPRQRVHSVPWALLATSAENATTANSATTLVNNATVDGVTVIGGAGVAASSGGSLRVGAQGDYGIAIDSDDIQAQSASEAATLYLNYYGGDVHLGDGTGTIRVKGKLQVDTRPVLIKRYSAQKINNATIDTGISYADYWCTVGGWFVNMDINENGYGPWGRWIAVNAQNNWALEMYNNVHGQTPNPDIWVDVVCFRHGIISTSNGTAPGVLAGADAPADPTVGLPASATDAAEMGQ